MSRNKLAVDITSSPRILPDFSECWDNRGLLWMFIRRNIKVRYTQTLLGSTWIVIQPLLLAGMLTVVIGAVLGAPSGDIPYPLFAFTGSAIWNTFQRAFSETSISFAGSANLIQKVYFPRILVPLSSALTTLVEFVPVFVALVIATLLYGRFPGLPILAMPFYLLLAFILAFGVGLWVTALDAIYRDLRLVVPSVLQMMMFASPVMYAVTAVPAHWRTLYSLNPLVPILEGFRWSLISGAPAPDINLLLIAVASSLFMLVTGLGLFTRLEQFAVDRI
jgi:lipopolysaccharide transport system permease protein